MTVAGRVAGRVGVVGLAAFTLLALAGAAGATPGDLDPTFGDNGRVLIPVGGQGGIATASVVQPDDKIVLAGNTLGGNQDVLVVRLNANGSLDSTFGSGGVVQTPVDLRANGSDQASAVALGPGGRIVVAGHASTPGDGTAMIFLRYRADGELDTTFGEDGLRVLDLSTGGDYARGVAVDSYSRIVAAGWSWVAPWPAWTVLRLRTDGALDATFGSGGVVRTAVARSSDGDAAEAVAVGPDGRILVAGTADSGGYYTEDFAVARYLPSGELDPGFGTNGIAVTPGVRADFVADLELLPDGRLVVVGNSAGNDPYDSEFRLARYSPAGVLDTTFGTDGIVVTDFPGTYISEAESVAVQADGKLVVGGRIEFDYDVRYGLARYLEDGSLDPGFASAGTRTYDISCENDPAYPVAVQRLGARERIVLAGASYCYADRFLAAIGVHGSGPQPQPPPPIGYTISVETGQWLARGTTDIGNHCDDCVTPITFPFPVTVYGQQYTTANVSSNGSIQFDTGGVVKLNRCLPAAALGAAFLPYWDDLVTSRTGDGIYSATFFTPPSRVFALEWRAQYLPDRGTANFVALFTEGSGVLRTIYGTMTKGGSASTEGVQSSATGFAARYGCNDTGGAVSNGLAVTYTPTPIPPPPPASRPPAPRRCRVPNVVGRRLAVARRLIRRRGCAVGRVRRARSRRAAGIVVRQSVRPGARVRRGARIRLVVSRGRR